MSQAESLPRIESAGLDAWLVRLFDTIDETNLPWMTALTRACERALGGELVDLVPSYTTLLVVFDPLRLDPDAARRRIEAQLAKLTPDEEEGDGQLHELATWYDISVGPELPRLAERSGLNVNEVIACHSERVYRVFALGFAPGFAFMGLLDERLECPRLDTPRRRVPMGSVAVTGRQTAAYPTVTPGGWNLIGRTSAALFDRHRDGFSLLRMGDRVRFVSVDRAAFEAAGGDMTPMDPALTNKEHP